jgi:3-oxoacyl-[acyl-carrier-protein] synthase III
VDVKIGIEAMAAYLPGETVNVKEYYKYLEPEIQKLSEENRRSLLDTAPKTVRRLKDPSALEHMALSAAEKAVSNAGLAPSDIDGLLVTQTGGKQFMPLLASYLQLNLGLRKEIVARNIGDGNISVQNMLNLARVYIESGTCRRVLIIAASAQIGGKYGFGADLTEPWCMHLGDGAGAAIVSSENIQCELLSSHFETYAVTPRKTGLLNGDYGSVRQPNNRSLCFDAEMDDAYGAYLVCYDSKLREIAGRKAFFTDVLERAAGKADIRANDVKHIITAHIGDLMESWKRDMSASGMNPESLINRQNEIGNTACADVLIDLAHFSDAEIFKADDLIALWVSCTGVRVAVTFFRWRK